MFVPSPFSHLYWQNNCLMAQPPNPLFPEPFADKMINHPDSTGDGCYCATYPSPLGTPNTEAVCVPPPGIVNFCWGTMTCNVTSGLACSQSVPVGRCDGTGGYGE